MGTETSIKFETINVPVENDSSSTQVSFANLDTRPEFLAVKKLFCVPLLIY